MADADDSIQLRRAARRAVADNNTSLYAALLQSGLEIDQSIAEIRDDASDLNLTALMFAVVWGKREMVSWLLDQGASEFAATKDHVRPIDLALALKREDLANLMTVPTRPADADKDLPRAAIRIIRDLFDLPKTLQVFVALNGTDPSDEFTKAIARWSDITFPISMARVDPTLMKTQGSTRYWFSNRISDEIGVRLAVTTKPLPNRNAWDVVCQLEGRPVKETSAVQSIPMPVEKITGRLIQRHGWWVLEERQPPVKYPVPEEPKPGLRHADLAQLAADTCWQGNITLINALIDGGVDPTIALNPEDPYSETLLETAAWSSNPRFVAALLKKAPTLRANRNLLHKAAQRAFDEGNEAALTALERPLSGLKTGPFPVELIDDLIGDSSQDGKAPLFITFNDADPDKAIMAHVKKHWPTAVPFSDAVEGDFKQDNGETFGSAYQLRSTKKNGTKVEITLGAEDDGTWSYSIRHTRGFLAGGGTKGRLVFSHGYWFTKNAQGWDE